MAGSEKALVFARVPEELSNKLNAGKWAGAALSVLGGKGGGKPSQVENSWFLVTTKL